MTLVDDFDGFRAGTIFLLFNLLVDGTLLAVYGVLGGEKVISIGG